MKRRLFALAFPFILILSGCFGDLIQDDLVNYFSVEMENAYELEEIAISAYDSVSGNNYTNDEVMYYALVDEVVPNYSEFIDELDNVIIETEELKVIHQIFIEGAEKQLEGFEMIIDALVAQDTNLVQAANVKLTEGKKLIEKYTKKINKLAEEHNVEFED